MPCPIPLYPLTAFQFLELRLWVRLQLQQMANRPLDGRGFVQSAKGNTRPQMGLARHQRVRRLHQRRIQSFRMSPTSSTLTLQAPLSHLPPTEAVPEAGG